jgi:hypothetical protein
MILYRSLFSLELQIKKQYETVSISEGNELENNNLEKKQNKKTQLTWEAQLSMTTMLVTFGLIPFIPMMGFSIIIFSRLISVLCCVN